MVSFPPKSYKWKDFVAKIDCEITEIKVKIILACRQYRVWQAEAFIFLFLLPIVPAGKDDLLVSSFYTHKEASLEPSHSDGLS